MKKTLLSSFGVLMLLAFALASQISKAVILFGSGDPAYNTTPPTGAFQDSGWQYEGQWGGVLGTPIAPQYFIAAQHVGGSVGQTFVFNGASYTTTAYWNDPSTDLRIWKVDGTFPTYAPLYATNDEAGKTLVVIGRGTQRGDSVGTPVVQTVAITNVADLSALGISEKVAQTEFPNASFVVIMTVVTPVYVTNVVDLKALGISERVALMEFPNATFDEIMTVVTPVYTTNVVNLNTLGISLKTAKAEFPNARFQGSIMTVVTPVYTTNVVNLNALGISLKAAKAEFPNAKFQGSIMTVVTPVYTTNVVDLDALGISLRTAKAEFPNATFDHIMTVVTPVYTTNVVNLNTLGISKRAAQAEFPNARFQGSIMTVMTPVYTTNVVNLNVLGISLTAAQAEFPNATFDEIMTVVTSGLVTNTLLKGWQDGPSDGAMRWGQNKVRIASSCLVAAFTGTNGPDEGYLSVGDSSGAVFIKDNTGAWKLAGINYGIDGPFATNTNSPAFYGAIFDENNLFVNGYLMPNDGRARNAFYYATRISPRVSWIQSVISQ